MSNLGSSNPVTPVYTQAKPIKNEGCVTEDNGNNLSFFVPAGDGKSTEILAGDQIKVENLSDANTDRFRVSYDPATQLTLVLNAVPYIAGQVQTEPILKGKTVDQIALSWTYNIPVESQVLSNDGGLTDPTLSASQTDATYIGLTLGDTVNITLDGDSGSGVLPESQASDTEQITFGNYLAFGAGGSLINQANTAQTLLNGFISASQTEIRTNRVTQVYGLGGSNQKFFVMYPKAWGLATFQKGIFVGGFVRLKLVSGVLKDVLGGGDIEENLLLSNGEGHTEAFYIYESLFDNQADPVTPIDIL